MKRIETLFLATVLVVYGCSLAFADGTEAKAERYRLVLASGAVYEVTGPVERKGGMLLFRDERGQLASVRETEVREVRPVSAKPASAPAQPAPTPAPAAVPEAPTVRYGNTDLTPLPEPPPEPEPVEAPEEVAGAPEPPAAPASILPEPPAEVGGKSEDWWRAEIGRLRGEIAELEQQEAVTYRLWVCAMHDIPLAGGDCRPRVNELPPVNRLPRTPTQKSLNADLVEVRGQIQGKRDELASFIDEAIAAGVPTSWLLAVLEEEAAPAAGEANEDSSEQDEPEG